MSSKFRYKVVAKGSGGEYTIGTVDENTSEYWLAQGKDKFKEYMISNDRREVNSKFNVPEEFQLPSWYEIDNIKHLNSAEFHSSTTLHITDLTLDEEIKMINLNEEMINVICYPSNELEETNLSFWESIYEEGENCIVYGGDQQKGSFSFESIESESPFDNTKLKINCTEWVDLRIIHSLEYNGKIYLPKEADTIHEEMAIWIDD